MSAPSGTGTPRSRFPPPLASTPVSSPASARRRGVTPSVMSPLSTLANSSPAHSFRSNAYPSSSRSPESVSGQSLLQLAPSTRYRTFSAAASQAGSLATTTANTTGPTRFKRSHARRRPGQPQPPPPPAVVKSANPDDVDLLALEDPDDVFKAFGVRDVRKLEQRASEAAAAKVAELRSMVGERYRDLLAAADSIVRMRTAADNLVDRIETAESGLGTAGAAMDDSPSKRRHSLRSTRRPSSPGRDRTLSSSTTVAHAIQLLLSIPSLVHAKLDQADYLEAARLEDFGQLVYRELSTFEVESEIDGEVSKRRLAQMFPLIDKQADPLAALKPLIVRRATASLQDWETEPAVVARTLAALAMIRQVGAAQTLATLLEARSSALADLLQTPASTSRKHDADSVVIAERLYGVLALVLRTVEAAHGVFGEASTGVMTLEGLVEALRSPDQHAGATRIEPLVEAFANAAALHRHLPPTFLSYRPAIVSKPVDSNAVQQDVAEWTRKRSIDVLSGFSGWISSMSEAKALADLRHTGRRAFSTAQPSSSSATTANELQSQLESAIENRLAEVYRARLDTLVARVKPSVEALLLALPDSAADLDQAVFLFESPLVFPSASLYAPSRRGQHALADGIADPFESFLVKVGKRVDGRSPLLDRGLSELEDEARAIHNDLTSWLGPGDTEGGAGEAQMRERLRKSYVDAACEALIGVADAIAQVLEDVKHDVDGSLFLGNLAFLLGESASFTSDLLLTSETQIDSSALANWHDKLRAVQHASLDSWRERTVQKAVSKLRESLTLSVARSPEAMIWAWEAASGHAASDGKISPTSVPVPAAPSAATLSALTSLATALRRVGLHRNYADPSIASSLLAAFAEQVVGLAQSFASEVESMVEPDPRLLGEVGVRVAWDLALLAALSPAEKSDAVLSLQVRFLALAPEGWHTPDRETLRLASLDYLQGAQSVLGNLLPNDLKQAALESPTGRNGAIVKSTPALSKLLPLGPAMSAFATLGDLHGASAGLVKPGPRLGLLPTRG